MITIPAQDFDGPWKTAVEVYFKDFMRFFFPKIHEDIQWEREYTFLDKELEKIVRDAKIGKRYSDKLVKVFLKDGQETWLLIHIEIQGYRDKDFPQRMFIYYYRIFDRYDAEVVSLAVLSDDNPEYRPSRYRKSRWGWNLIFEFPIVKVLDYGKDWKALEADQNPFSIVVMAHLKARGIRDNEERKAWKIRLIRMLFARGYEREDVFDLFRFIDWLLILPEELEKVFKEELDKIVEEFEMPYFTSIERVAAKDGMQKGEIKATRENIIDILATRFQSLPEGLINRILKLEDQNLLKTLVKKAAVADSVDMFSQNMDSGFES